MKYVIKVRQVVINMYFCFLSEAEKNIKYKFFMQSELHKTFEIQLLQTTKFEMKRYDLKPTVIAC